MFPFIFSIFLQPISVSLMGEQTSQISVLILLYEKAYFYIKWFTFNYINDKMGLASMNFRKIEI